MTTIMKPEYVTVDSWQAGYLDLMGLRLTRVELEPSGRPRWIFDNTEPEPDRAWNTGREFRTHGLAVVPLLEYRDSFRKMHRAAESARRERAYNDDDNRN